MAKWIKLGSRYLNLDYVALVDVNGDGSVHPRFIEGSGTAGASFTGGIRGDDAKRLVAALEQAISDRTRDGPPAA